MTFAHQLLGHHQTNLLGIYNIKISIGDDNVIYKWNTNTNQATKFMDLDNYAVDLDWIPMTKGSS